MAGSVNLVENEKVEKPGIAGLGNWLESGISKPNRGYRKKTNERGGARQNIWF